MAFLVKLAGALGAARPRAQGRRPLHFLIKIIRKTEGNVVGMKNSRDFLIILKSACKRRSYYLGFILRTFAFRKSVKKVKNIEKHLFPLGIISWVGTLVVFLAQKRASEIVKKNDFWVEKTSSVPTQDIMPSENRCFSMFFTFFTLLQSAKVRKMNPR